MDSADGSGLGAPLPEHVDPARLLRKSRDDGIRTGQLSELPLLRPFPEAILMPPSLNQGGCTLAPWQSYSRGLTDAV